MKKEDCYHLGYFASLHGKSGDIILRFDVDNPAEYIKMESFLVEFNTDLIPFFIESIQVRGDKAILRLEDVENEEQASELLGMQIYLPLSTLPKLSGKKFYYHEIIGFTVVDKKDGTIGTIQNVYDNTQQPIFGVHNGKNEILIPAVDEFIIEIDRSNKTIQMALPEGLVDLYDAQ